MNRNRALWIVQGLLAALFLFAGGMKLITLPTLLFGVLAGLVAYGRRPSDLHIGAARSTFQPAH
jgi:hypothetical protein